MDRDDQPTFFETPEALRAWIVVNHASADELWVGFHKKATGRPSITWPELVDELLCFGWIDGLRKSIDDERWMIRITPRRSRSSWSDVNQQRFAALSEQGRVAPGGFEAYRRWKDSAAGRAAAAADRNPEGSGEVRSDEGFPVEFDRRLRARPDAWEFFQAQPAGYRRTATRWVMSAKREETRLRRLETMIADSAAGLRIKELRR
jgi:uncharacterized protein YdeI (YjbR/CyaY-like superfamily)